MSNRRLPVDDKTAKATVAVLSPILTDLIELKLQVKHGHWNLRDLTFVAIHRYFDEVAGLADEATDEVAERIRQLGAVVTAPTATVATSTTLKPFPKGELKAPAAVDAVSERLHAVITGIRAGIAATSSGEHGEPITADLLTQLAGKMEVQLWFLESHLG